MKSFWDTIHHHNIQYVEYASKITLKDLLQTLQEEDVTELYTADPVDYILEKRLRKYASKHQLKLVFLPNRIFLNSKTDNQAFLLDHQHKKLFFTTFYIYQRLRLNILTDSGKPIGGKWSFDTDNRKKLPKGHQASHIFTPSSHPAVLEAQRYIAQHFPDHLGNSTSFSYPVTRSEALDWLRHFIMQRLEYFGLYEDAVDQDNHTLYHSVLSPLLNIGLLIPKDVLEHIDEYIKEHPDYALNTVEGFVRQIIGWREYVRLVYERNGVEQRTKNALHHNRQLKSVWYNAQTQLPPVDRAIQAVLKSAYTHHIERLMILGNVMALCEVDPDHVYRWFMEMFIDAYDWVMVPNVYGMSQFADGGLMTTKPYISGSNYVLKMSNYAKGDWTKIWDALFWRYIHKHQTIMRQNMRTQQMVHLLGKMDQDKKTKMFALAQQFIEDTSALPSQ